jgi:hypothetical protein
MPHEELLTIARTAAPVAEQEPRIRRVLDAHGVPAELVLARASEGIVLLEDGAGPSRLGGPALLPPGEEWPHTASGRPLTFLAALDLAALGAFAPLPTTGVLLIYCDVEFEDLDFVDGTRVFHVPDAPVPATEPEDAYAFDAIALSGVRTLVPGTVDDLPDEAHESWDELWPAPFHQLLGTSFDVQGPVLDEIEYWFSTYGADSKRRFTDEERAGKGWSLLGQIDSTADLMFGDAGTVYFVIPDLDLAAGRFDRVMGIMQCA